MAKWSNYFISGKQFQKMQNGNPAVYHQCCEKIVEQTFQKNKQRTF